MNIRSIIFLMMIALILVGCVNSVPSQAQPTNVNVNPTRFEGASAYPSPLGAQSYPAAEQTDEPALIESVPTPGQTDKATITGYINNRNGDKTEPAVSTILYLAEVMYQNGTPTVAGFDRSSPLKTITDSKGRFVFTDVPFNAYSIVVDKISEAYLLSDPVTGGDLLIAPKESKIYDLGELTYGAVP